ncbi:hypothetical protein Agabi119p4_9078 [Agaricus bisporus var. burnettii]|uniref:Uncharacterized protein n=1 Tax=Agaricus bisporus var. burnettii TaxID=192524 RepID=A0A8H7C5M0_AGABI|nr:hypothetical protein Agabi119p4_9078 [Agaricus bisporus var. burnettii]
MQKRLQKRFSLPHSVKLLNHPYHHCWTLVQSFPTLRAVPVTWLRTTPIFCCQQNFDQLSFKSIDKNSIQETNRLHLKVIINNIHQLSTTIIHTRHVDPPARSPLFSLIFCFP